MDIKLTTYIEFEIVKSDDKGASRIYRFNMPYGAPYPEAKEACGDAFNGLSEMEVMLAKKQQEMADEAAQLEVVDNNAAPVADAPIIE